MFKSERGSNMKRKILPIIFIVALLVLCLVSCDISGGQNNGNTEHEHTGGEASCLKRAVCDICGKSYGEKAEHDYSEATCTAPEVCKICRNTRGESVDHSFTAASCTEPSVCRFCGKEDAPAIGHSYDTIEHDSVSHWYTCSTCNDKKDNEAHHGGIATCTDLAKCSDCGTSYGTTAPHNYSEATCTDTAVCSACGDEKAALGHSWKSTLSYNDTEHWYACTRCDETKDLGVHTGGEATEKERAVCEVCGQHYGEKIEITIDWVIEAESPADGSDVILLNKLIRTWADGYDYRTTDTDAYWLCEDVFIPDVPIFKWTVGEKAGYYKFYISKNADMSSAECYITAYCEASVPHLLVDTDYYWYVDAVYADYTVRSEKFEFHTSRTTRTVDIDGVSNVRDLGGYITIDGKQIKQGMIYRSAKLDDITELGKYTLVNILGVKTDLDLRGDKATKPVSELNHIATACPWYSTGSNHIWMNDTNKEEFAKTVKVFADPDNYPIIFHCSLGRDRTGTLAMVLGGLLGLDENTLMMEYELSVFSYWGTNGTTKFNNGLRKNIHDTYLYIDDNYGDNADSFSEKVELFLIDIGVTAEEIASIKSIMLEEVE